MPRTVGMPHLHVTLRWKESLGPADSPRLRDLWVRLRCSAGEVVAAVVLPDRLELVQHVDGTSASLEWLSTVAVRAGLVAARAEPSYVRDDDVVAVRHVLGEVITRPSCLGVVDDPLVWPWSTARDVLGAVVDPWVGVERSCVDVVARTGRPRAADPSDTPSLPIGEVLRAAAAATRRPVAAVRRPGPTRRLFVGLAHRHGWWMPRQLASICGVARRTLYSQLERVPASWLRAGDLCLGDHRLRTIVLASPAGRPLPLPVIGGPACSSP